MRLPLLWFTIGVVFSHMDWFLIETLKERFRVANPYYPVQSINIFKVSCWALTHLRLMLFQGAIHCAIKKSSWSGNLSSSRCFDAFFSHHLIYIEWILVSFSQGLYQAADVKRVLWRPASQRALNTQCAAPHTTRTQVWHTYIRRHTA